MPTILTHALLPAAACGIAGRRTCSTRLIFAAMVAAVVPDLDVLGFRFGVPYEASWGHRGATHSLAFAVVLGLGAALSSRWLRSTKRTAFVVVAFAAASHALTDMLTNGGLGVALWWPFSQHRYFWPFRPVEVSTIGSRALTDGGLITTLASELSWLLAPTLFLAILVRRAVQTR